MASTVTVPAHLGQIQHRSKGSNGRTIMLFQEAHVDYAIQRSIADILKGLQEREGLRLILVEGGWGDVGLSHLRDYSDLERRQSVADQFLKEGKISGEEYLDIVSDRPIELWGIEDPDLYAANMEAFFKIDGRRKAWLDRLSRIEKALAPLEEAGFPKDLLDFLGKRREFERQQISLLEYFTELTSRHPFDAKDFPNLGAIAPLVSQGGTLDLEGAMWEKDRLVGALSRILTKSELDLLRVFEVRKTPEAEGKFVRDLLKTYGRHRARLGPLPTTHLRHYMSALARVAAMNPKALHEEIRTVERLYVRSLGLPQEALKVWEIGEEVRLLEKLFSLGLGPVDFKELEDPSFSEKISGWASLLKASKEDIKGVARAVPEALAFYRSARRREEALVRNTLEKLRTAPDPLAAVIVGGFHADILLEAFEKQGYGVTVVIPNAESASLGSQHEKYLEILRHKWQSHLGGRAEPVPITSKGG